MKSRRIIFIGMLLVCLSLLSACGNQPSTNGSETVGGSSQNEKEAPIVQVTGDVSDAAYEKVVNAFEDIVRKMRADGLVKQSDVCVTMDETSIKVDITFDNSDVDLVLVKNEGTEMEEYTLTFDYNYSWLEDFGPKVNGKDPAKYNKELMLAILSTISEEPDQLFARIDLDCFSAASLSESEWEKAGDAFIKSGGWSKNEYISYNIAK